MKIDRNLYRSFRKKIYEDETIKNFVNEQNFEEAEEYLKKIFLINHKNFLLSKN